MKQISCLSILVCISNCKTILKYFQRYFFRKEHYGKKYGNQFIIRSYGNDVHLDDMSPPRTKQEQDIVVPEIYVTEVASSEPIQAFPKDSSNMSVSSSEMKYDSLKDGRARAKSIEPQQYITNHSDVRSDVSSENGTDEIRPLTNKNQTIQSKSNRENQFSNRRVIRADIDSSVRSLPRQPKLTRKPPFRYVYSEW